MVTAILTAGGTGSRMQKNIPKQFMTVNEIPVIIYTLQQFQKSTAVDEIIVACLSEWQPVLRAYAEEFDISKLVAIVSGGKTGIESIQNAFTEVNCTNEDDLVMIHDGNRPLIEQDVIERNIDTAKEIGATTTYIDIHDGIVRVDEALNILKSDFKREDIKSTQTPHSFKYSVISSVLSEIGNAEYISVADAATRLGYDVGLVRGSEMNFKITTPNDLRIFESVINSRQKNV